MIAHANPYSLLRDETDGNSGDDIDSTKSDTKVHINTSFEDLVNRVQIDVQESTKKQVENIIRRRIVKLEVGMERIEGDESS